jgi:hypothetical protein
MRPLRLDRRAARTARFFWSAAMKSGWMVVAAILFALMGVLVKQASGDFSSAELVFYRSAFGLAAIWGVIAWRSGRLFSPLATQPWCHAFLARTVRVQRAGAVFLCHRPAAAGDRGNPQLHGAAVSCRAVGVVAARAPRPRTGRGGDPRISRHRVAAAAAGPAAGVGPCAGRAGVGDAGGGGLRQRQAARPAGRAGMACGVLFHPVWLPWAAAPGCSSPDSISPRRATG